MSAPVTFLSLLIEESNDGYLKVIDQTQSLNPDTSVIELPPEFAPLPGDHLSL